MSRHPCLWLLLFVGLSACATQRPYQPPSPLPQGTTYEDSTLFFYRTLTVEDFKAPFYLGEKSRDVEGDVGAATVVFIDTTPYRLLSVEKSNADSSYFEAYADTFRYRASFDQTHSWFNPSYKAEAGPLLAHEQIHFAIAELAVRRANAELPQIHERIRSCRRERLLAVIAAHQRFLEELWRVRNETNARQNAFDRETENGTHIGESRHWSIRIGRELKATADKKPALLPLRE